MSAPIPDTPPTSTVDLSQSGVTIPSDSENYEANNDLSPPSSSSGSPLILYSPPTIWGLLRGAGINLVLPFINGLMLGFGELFAHEIAFRLGWAGTKVCSGGLTSINHLHASGISNTQGRKITPSRPRSHSDRRPRQKEKKRWRGIGYDDISGVIARLKHLHTKATCHMLLLPS